ncbi:MAG: radical SAM protein, partial [Planctomycetaceae bacterium]
EIPDSHGPGTSPDGDESAREMRGATMTETSNSPTVELEALDALWFQVAGTLCNLECTHCFISCSPKNNNFGYMSRDAVERLLEQSVAWGTREYYFTGGEPFLNPNLVEMLISTLQFGPATVLTNGTVLRSEWLSRLWAAETQSLFSLEFRVSIDGPTAQLNDAVRGDGSFNRALRGVRMLVENGFLPIITMTRLWSEAEDAQVLGVFRDLLAEVGYLRPRLKVLPRLQLGAELDRTSGYGPHDRVTHNMLDGYDVQHLVCSHSRVATDRGIYVCPILLDSPDAHLGQTLEEAHVGFSLDHGACMTCYQYGAICSNISSIPQGDR